MNEVTFYVSTPLLLLSYFFLRLNLFGYSLTISISYKIYGYWNQSID